MRSDAYWAKPITRSFDLDDDGVEQEAIEEPGRDDGIAEDFAPLGEAAVGREDHRAPLIPAIDELEEQIAAARRDRQVSDFVDDKKCWPAQVADAFAQHAIAFGFGQRSNDVGQGREVDAAADLYGFDGERRRQMGFPRAGRAEEVDNLVAMNEVELRPRSSRWPALTLPSSPLLDKKRILALACQCQRCPDTLVVAHRAFLDEHLIESLDAVDLALLDAPQGGVEHLEGAWHPKCDQAAFDAVDGGGGGMDGHDRPPTEARRSPTA
jgi:hypothetical protein